MDKINKIIARIILILIILVVLVNLFRCTTSSKSQMGRIISPYNDVQITYIGHNTMESDVITFVSPADTITNELDTIKSK